MDGPVLSQSARDGNRVRRNLQGARPAIDSAGASFWRPDVRM